MRQILASLMVLPFLTACATTPWEGYWQKPTKYKEMPQKGSDQAVATLSLNASRRLVIGQRIGSDRFTCPEPPPDVSMNTLNQVLASLQASDGSAASYGASSQAISQVLSSRTSVVEFWRTTSSMYCVLLMNNRTTEATNYLNTAAGAMNKMSDTAFVAQVAPSFIDGLNAQITVLEAQRKRLEEVKAAEVKRLADLAEAKKKCEAVAADKKAADENCKRAVAG